MADYASPFRSTSYLCPGSAQRRHAFACPPTRSSPGALLLPLDRPAIMRKRQAKILAQRLALIFRAEQAAALQLRNQHIDDVLDPARYRQRQDVEAVRRAAAEPLFERVGDFGRGAYDDPVAALAVDALI